MTRIAKRPPDSLFAIVSDAWTAPFWEGAAQGKLTVCRCGRCGRFRMPPTAFCPNCRSQEVDWTDLPGTGTLYTYTIVERAIMPELEDCIPYVPAVVELDGAPGIRLITNIVDSPIDAIIAGARVSVLFDAVEGGAVPRFRIIEDAA